MNVLNQLAFSLAEGGYMPDVSLRLGIRYLLRDRLDEIQIDDSEHLRAKQADFIEEMRSSAVALVPEKANEQHYEVPAQFFQQVLGPHLKYSSGYWPAGVSSLANAELEGIQNTCAHAQLENHQDILELGCGWGSLTLWMAETFPDAQITAVSNSHTQREYILGVAKKRGLDNVQIITCDVNDFDVQPGRFDRIVSVEMFEHMRNWKELFSRICRWLKPGGRFFMHIFSHCSIPYAFEDKGPNDWMSRHFFTGGMMPSHSLPLAFQDDLKCVQQWKWDGTHYEKTANAWLNNMDASRETLWPLFIQTYGKGSSSTWWMRWRIFFMACAELFGYKQGQEWGVSHYLFEKPQLIQ